MALGPGRDQAQVPAKRARTRDGGIKKARLEPKTTAEKAGATAPRSTARAPAQDPGQGPRAPGPGKKG